jgi:hypothetical protein
MSKPIVPPARPNLTREQAEAYFAAPYGDLDFDKFPLYRLSIRGYYKKSLGDASRNDFGIYDDAIFLLTKDGFWAFNANCDPSKVSRGTKTKKGTAILMPGIYYAQGLDLHQNRYPALCQRLGSMEVWRYKEDGSRWTDAGYFGINCHCGGKIATNSEGCETIYPMQYGEFMYTVVQAVGQFGWNGKCVPNLLIEY